MKLTNEHHSVYHGASVNFSFAYDVANKNEPTMKLFVIAIALFLAAYVSGETNAADGAPGELSVEYLPPEEEAGATPVAKDGYRYRTVRKLKYRHRRAVSQEYLPPVEEPSQEYLPPVPETKVADDGYRYKTVRKLKYRARHRRDVSEIAPPSNEYLPPVEVELAPELKTVVGDDGYRYRTIRRLKYRRHRREAEADAAEAVDAAPVNEYLPPAEGEVAAEEVPEVKSAELAKDGYRYKTVRKLRYRYRN